MAFTLLLIITCMAGMTGSTSGTCRGPHCPGRPVVPYTIVHPQHGSSVRENPRTLTAEVFVPQCTGRGCRSPANATEGCRGIGCRLPPLGMRVKPRQSPCPGEGCPVGVRGRSSQGMVVKAQDRVEHVLRDFPDREGSPLGIQLTCDVKPGSNEVPSEDALVLQLRVAKGQEKLVEELQTQQSEIKQLQSRLTEQQGTLVAQQKEILEQQRRMFEQMDQVKTQYNLLLDSVRHMSLQDPHKILEGHLENLRPQMRSHEQEAYTMHKVDMDASVMEVGRFLPGCGSCRADEYCDFSGDWPRCEKCTVCLPGFFLVSQCSIHADRMCQDRDECLEIQNLCGAQNQCLNTPGGFKCTGLSVKDAADGVCGHAYFYNLELQECQACSECDSQSEVSPCTAMSDTVCTSPSDTGLSIAWSGDVALAPDGEFPNMELHIQGNSDGSLVSSSSGQLVFHQHGLVWVDQNLALRHGCRSFVQVCLRLNASEEGGRDLSGIRVEQREGKSLQSISLSAASTVEPGQVLSLFLKSASHHCNPDNEKVHLETSLVSPFSLLWLSHDTGAVAMTAQAVASAHFHTNYRPTFRTSSISDPYIVSLTHDSRGVRFTERGTVKFVLQQAVYSMGQACVSEGFYLSAFVNHNGSSVELTRVFKPGVHYRDSSITLSSAAPVDAGDTLSFEIQAPAQCNVRYFGDDSGISMLSLVWIPSVVSSSISATISSKGLPFGAVRNKALLFRQTSPSVAQVDLAGAGHHHPHRNFIFKEAGTASVALDLRLIHSCSLIKLSLLKQAKHQGAQSTALAQQAGGQMPEGSEWATVGLRVSFPVNNGTEVFATVDCVRGRLNQIAHDVGSSISILWTAA
ncbi:hypothetical protein AMEX_G10398 [Astyanax mexicanus]|uniref:TNFR-Cys domain-containing protein n=1 Tax=Astyanax mexicanus TaxID=7994 RepID=A0A8T2LP80_ASTMX|nr:hypothetical protein AMEX_G10398 [Astyanax mexicanus]